MWNNNSSGETDEKETFYSFTKFLLTSSPHNFYWGPSGDHGIADLSLHIEDQGVVLFLMLSILQKTSGFLCEMMVLEQRKK